MNYHLIIISISSFLLFSCAESNNNQVNHNSNNKNHEMHDSHAMETLTVEKRIAFMSGHVEAGLALYRAGKPEQAAKHLLHPVSEMHEAERVGIDSLGFNAEVFKSVSKALAEGKSAIEIEQMLKEAEENIMLIQKNAGGNLKDIITFLMETTVTEYKAGVSDGKIIEAGEYQDAFGFSVVALKMSNGTENDKSAILTQELMKLVNMWPQEGPLADSTPKPLETIIKQTQSVLENL